MMKSLRWVFALALTVPVISGCAICCGPEDYTYATFGGKYERVDPVYGRVGSVFSDPNADWGTPFDPGKGEPDKRDGEIPIPNNNQPETTPGGTLGNSSDTALPSILFEAELNQPKSHR